MHAFVHLILGFKNRTFLINPVFVALRLLNMILLVVSSCVTNSELLNPHSFYLCISIGLSGPPPSLSSLTLTKTYCTRTCQPVHILALCVAVTSSSDCTLSVYTTESVSHQAQSLCPQRLTVQENPHHHCHYSSILPLSLHQPASAHKLLCLLNAASIPLTSTRIPSTNEMHISAHKMGQMQLLQMWAGSNCGSAVSCSFTAVSGLVMFLGHHAHITETKKIHISA